MIRILEMADLKGSILGQVDMAPFVFSEVLHTLGLLSSSGQTEERGSSDPEIVLV